MTYFANIWFYAKSQFAPGYVGAGFLAVFLFISTAWSASFVGELEPDTIYVGESATLSYSFENMNSEASPEPPEVEGLRFVSRGISNQLTLIQGVQTSKVIHQFAVQATQPGTYVIPGIEVVVSGRKYKSKDLTLKVVASGDRDGALSGLDRYAFLRMNPEKEAVFLGEPFPITLDVYVTGGNNLQLPKLESEGFTFAQPLEMGQRRVRVQGQVYTVVQFKLMAVPVKAGDLTLGPAECNLNVHIPLRRPTFFQTHEERPVTLQSDSKTIKVSPLPNAGRPKEFSGAVGNFEFEVSVGPDQVSVGDPITLKALIKGQGNWDRVNLTEPASWREFKVYPATSKVETQDKLGFQGKKEFEQVLIPENAEIESVPALSFCFFDPDKKQFVTLTKGPFPISVKSTGTALNQSALLAKQEVQVADPRDNEPAMAHIKSKISQVGTLPGVFPSPLFWWVQTVPVALYALVSAWKWRNRKLARNPSKLRKIQVDAIIRKGLGDLKKHAQAGEGEAFFAVAFRLLQERLGERLKMSATSITESVVHEHLDRCEGVTEDLKTDVERIFMACNQARYAPDQNVEHMKDWCPVIESILNRLQNIERK